MYGDPNDLPGNRYRVAIVDQTPLFLDEGDGGSPAMRRDSGWLTSWADATAALARYPWPHLVPIHVDASIANEVWRALEEYVAKSARPVRPHSITRWREACGYRDASQLTDAHDT